MTLILLAGFVPAAWASITPAGTSTVEIRFGRIEPPVVAQRDITVRAATSNQQLDAMPLECSGLAWVEGQLIITSDRHRHLIFSCSVDVDQMTVGDPEPHVVLQNEQSLLDDAECITVRKHPGGTLEIYALCSLSNDAFGLPLPMRRHMLRLPIAGRDLSAGDPPEVLSAGRLREAVGAILDDAGVEPYRTYTAEFPSTDKNTYRWGNVEGMAFTPDGSLLLCGMRNPLHGTEAILFAVDGVEEAFRMADPQSLRLTDIFSLQLGERGVSDLCWDPLTKGYLIAAGKSNGPRLDDDQPFPPNTLDSALFWWSGNKSDAPMLIALVPDMTVEAVCRIEGTRVIAIGSDEGDVSEGREERQSVLTILDFPGWPDRVAAIDR